MAYIVQSDLDQYLSDQVLVQLTDDDNTKEVNPSIVSECIQGAEDEVNGYLARQYDTPLASPPGIIVEITTILAVYRLYLRRQRVPEDVTNMVVDARDKLAMIQSGTMLLPGTEETSNAADEVQFTANDRVSTRDTWSGW